MRYNYLVLKLTTNKKELIPILLPIILIVVYLIASYFLKDVFPSSDQLTHRFTRLFEKYGYELIFFGSFLEGAVVVNFFIPGGSIALGGAYLASRGLMSYPLLLLVSELGFSLGFFLDYLVGFYGVSDILEKAGAKNSIKETEKKIKKWGLLAFFVGYINHNLASIFATTAGVIKMDFKKFIFYNVLADSFWLLVYTGLVYLFGRQIQHLFENHALVAVLLVPILIGIVKIFKIA